MVVNRIESVRAGRGRLTSHEGNCHWFTEYWILLIFGILEYYHYYFYLVFEPGKGYDWWMKIGVKCRSMVNVFASLNIDGVSTGLDQANATGNLALESHLYPFT